MQNRYRQKTIIAIDVRAASFGFAVFEGHGRLLDWGVKSFRRGVNAVKIPASRKMATLLEEFSPRTLVVRNYNRRDAKKRTAMLAAILAVGKKHRIPAHLISKGVLTKAFALNEQNKYAVASAVAQQLPELAPKLPRKRKIWEGEDYRISIFDAAAAGIAYLKKQNQEPQIKVVH